MQATTACELPHSLDRIAFGTVRVKEIQSKMVGVLFPPGPVQPRVITGHTLGYQKHSMETMIVARFFRTANLILQSENDGGRVGNGKWFHYSMKPQSPLYAITYVVMF
jgi:hypothetical protein